MPATVVMPSLATAWFVMTFPIVIIDAAYVLLRAPPGTYADPLRHPFGDVLPLSLWNLYAEHDHRYASNDDAFVVAQSYLNLAEAALGLLALMVALLGFYRAGLVTAIVVSLMTVYKTVIFFLMDFVEKGKFTNHNSLEDKIKFIWAPSSFWIIIPSIILVQCFGALRRLDQRTPKKQRHGSPSTESDSSKKKKH